MADGDKEFDALEKLLADVQRTISDNDQFVRRLKEESIDLDCPEEESELTTDADTSDYEEL